MTRILLNVLNPSGALRATQETIPVALLKSNLPPVFTLRTEQFTVPSVAIPAAV